MYNSLIKADDDPQHYTPLYLTPLYYVHLSYSPSYYYSAMQYAHPTEQRDC